MGVSMHRSRRNGRAVVRGWLVPVLWLLGAAGVLAPAPGWAQLEPLYFTVEPDEVVQGECYTIDVETPNITLDVQYSFNGGSTETLYGWPRIGPYGTAEVCTSSSTPTGTYQFQAARNANYGGEWLDTDASVTVTAAPPPPPNFTIGATPTSRTVVAGGSTTYTVSVNPLNGFNAAVSLSASGWPSSERSFSSPSLASPYTASSTLTLTVPAGTTPGTRTVTVTGTSGNLSDTDTVTLTVVPPPDFTITATPASRTVVEGGSTTYTVSVNPLNGFTAAVSLSASGWPSSERSFSSPSLASPYTASSTLTLTVPAGTTPGTRTVTVTGTSGTLSHTDTVTLTVVPPPDFTIGATPASRTVVAGGSTTYAVSVNPLNGFNAAVSLSTSGWPSSERSFSSTPLTSPYTASSTLTLSVPAGTPAGTRTVTVTGTSGNLSDSDTVTLTVVPPPNFTIGATPASRTVVAGGSTTYAVSVNPLNGFNAAVSLSASGWPSSERSFSSPSLAHVYRAPWKGALISGCEPHPTTVASVGSSHGGLRR